MNEVTITGKSGKTDTDLVLHILANIPEAYENQVNKLEIKMIANPTTGMIKVVHKKLNTRYARIQKKRDAAPISDHERALLEISDAIA